MWIDHAIAIYSAIGALLLFLLQWAGRHLLDSLVWPVLADWAARFNRTWATNRAEGILHLYILEWKRSSDIRYLLVHVEQRISMIVLFPAAINMMLLFMLLLTPIVRPEERLSYGEVSFLVGLTLSLLVLFLWGMFTFPGRYISRFANPNEYREETIKRLRKLLSVTGKSTEEVEEYLARVPPLGQ